MLEILYYKTLPSTQLFLKQEYKNAAVQPPLLLYCDEQTDGIGSRGSRWLPKKGNLYMSFLLHLDTLPQDLPKQSLSIYFAQHLYEVLHSKGSNLWLKWPNDFYVENKKIGGVLTTIMGNAVVCGIGVNLVDAPEGFGVLDIKLKKENIIKSFIEKLEKNLSWKQVFRKYSVKFYKNKTFTTHNSKSNRISMADAKLCDDGSIEVDGERIYSLR